MWEVEYMRKSTWSFAIWWLIGGIHTAAFACESKYDPAAQAAWIPCVRILGGTQVFAVVLEQTGDNNFVLTSSEEYGLANPPVSSLKILITPVPVAIIFGYYPNGCVSAYGRPSFVETGNNIDIRLKARFLRRADIACTQAIVPFAEMVSLPDSVNSQTHTYSVNGVSITPSY